MEILVLKWGMEWFQIIEIRKKNPGPIFLVTGVKYIGQTRNKSGEKKPI